VIEVAIETSTRSGSVAVRAAGAGSDARVHETPLAGERAHASDLLPALERLLDELAPRVPRPARRTRIDALVVGTGPGSYTGLRVGIATALGLARGSGARILGVPSLEAFAWAELEPGAEGTIVLDARAGHLYLARYRRLAEEVLALDAPRAVALSELPSLLPADGTLFADEAAVRAAGLEGARLRVGVVPRAGALLELGSLRLARGASQRPEEIEPLYLQPFRPRTSR
jgi:tRNA threonylcarbamoyladenosine biosynthesis protein TsaB